MNFRSNLATSAARGLVSFTSATLAGSLLLGCIVGPETDSGQERLGETRNELNGWLFGTFRLPSGGLDRISTSLGDPADVACFMSGVAGNFNEGYQPTNELPSKFAPRPTSAQVSPSALSMAQAYQYDPYTQSNLINNYIKVNTTCFLGTTGYTWNSWTSSAPGSSPSAPVKITGLDASNRRQCFLTSLIGIHGSWDSNGSYARVVKKTTSDASHPTTGWYVEANLPSSGSARARVAASCVDFPAGTTLTSGAAFAPIWATTVTTLTSGPGIKGCALTGISGALDVDSWSEGALIEAPAVVDGDWTLTIKNSRTGSWACAK